MATVIAGWVAKFSATADGDALGSRTGTGLCTSNTVTITPVGGSGTYAYSWARVSGSALPQISSTTAATVSWSYSDNPPNVWDAVWRCTVSSTEGVPSVTVDVNVQLAWNT